MAFFMSMTFAHPWLLLPPLALLAGARGHAPAVVFSSLAPLRASGKPRRAKRGGVLLSLLIAAQYRLHGREKTSPRFRAR